MTVQNTTRLDIIRWTGDTDPFNRDQLDYSHASLETFSLKYGQRTVTGDAVRPTMTAAWRGSLFYDVTTGVLSYGDGTNWTNVVLAGKAMTGGNLVLDESINIVVGTSTGTRIGTSASQKIGFFNATPVVQPANTVSNRSALATLGLVASGGDTRFEVRTVTTRPGSGTTGETIFETRTNSVLIWNGTTWVGTPPCGTYMPFHGTTAPAGWLLCNGAAIDPTLTELIALLGANTPDLRGRTITGRSATSDAYSTSGQAEIPATVLFAFTPDTTTTAPAGSDVQGKALTNAGSVDNAPLTARMNWIVKV